MDRSRRRATKPPDQGTSNELSGEAHPQAVQPASPQTDQKMVSFLTGALSSAEVDQVQEDIRTKLTSLSKINTEMKRTQTKLDKLAEQRQQLKLEVIKDRWMLSTLRLFPNEVLSIIFECYVLEDDKNDPWVLMHVCRQWRLAAIHARRVWSRIMVTPYIPYVSRGLPKRRYEGFEVCHKAEHLQNALSRAAGSPLEVRIDNCRRSTLSKNAEATLRSLFQVLQRSNAYQQIRWLSTENSTHDMIKNVSFDGCEFSMLTTAWVTTSTSNLNQRIEKMAINLRDLRITQSESDGIAWDLSKLRSLATLNIQGAYGQRHGQEIYQTISSSLGLVCLEICDCSVSRSEGSSPVSIPTLHTLRLTSSKLNCKFDLPQLLELILKSSTILSSREDPLILLNINLLEVDSPPDKSSLCIRATSVRDVYVQFRSRHGDKHAIGDALPAEIESLLMDSIKPGRFSPKILHIRWTTVDSGALVHFLNAIPDLEELDIGEGVSLTKPFYEALAGCTLPMKSQTKYRVPVCPSLKRIKLSLHAIYHSATLASMTKWTALALLARSKGSYPLDESLFQESGGQWVRLV